MNGRGDEVKQMEDVDAEVKKKVDELIHLKLKQSQRGRINSVCVQIYKNFSNISSS